MNWRAKFVILMIAVAFVSTPFLANAGYEGKKITAETTIITPLGKEVKKVAVPEKEIERIEEKTFEIQNAIKVITDPSSDDDEKNRAMEIIEAQRKKTGHSTYVFAGRRQGHVPGNMS